jgi:hypothetical protein
VNVLYYQIPVNVTSITRISSGGAHVNQRMHALILRSTKGLSNVSTLMTFFLSVYRNDLQTCNKLVSLLLLLFQFMYRASFIILHYDQQMHNYFTNYNTPTCFDTIVSSSGSLQSIPCQVTQVFQMQLLVIQFTIMMFHIGFMQVLIL